MTPGSVTRSHRALSFSIASLFIIGSLVCLGALAPASAQTWNESPDAGALPGTAQITAGSGPLNTIFGSLFADPDVDMYCIQITDHANFRATLQCTIIAGPDIYLFDAAGRGVAVNQICQFSAKFISNAFVPSNGTYYVAVAAHGALAFAGPDQIWLSGQTSERAPDGPGAANPITSWGGNPALSGGNSYRIDMTGVGYCSGTTRIHSNSWGRLRTLYR